MLKAFLLALLVLFLICGAAILWLAPSRTPTGLLNGLDRLTGGGVGVERAGESIDFGDHGQRLDIWRPSSRHAGPRPVLIFFYGGAWRTGVRADYAFVGRALARLGYIVVIPDYRKAPAAIFPAFMDDAAQALAWTQRHIREHGGDPDRIGLVGHSAGAHIAMLLALDTRWMRREDLPANIVKVLVGISGPYDFYPFTDDATRSVFTGSQPQENQPIHFARADAPPMLLIASKADRRVQARNSIAMADRLRSAASEAQLVMLDNLSHEASLLALMPQLQWLAPVRSRTRAFLASTLTP